MGAVVEVRVDGQPRRIAFDRWALVTENGPIDAVGLADWPDIYFNTDQPFVNQNPRTREFVLAEDLSILRPTNAERGCNLDLEAVGPVLEPISLDEWVESWLGNAQYLQFNEAGEVVEIRVQIGC